MKVLQIYTYYPPENVASTHLKKDLVDAYVKAGFDLCVVTPIPSRGINESTYKEYKNKYKEPLYGGKVVVNRFPIFKEGRFFVFRIIRYLLINIKQFFHAIKMRNVDVISSGSTPPTQGLVCSLLKKRLRVPFVYNLQDIFPDSLVNTGTIKRGSLFWKIGRRIENTIYQAADLIITISEDGKHNIMEKGVPEEKVIVIPNWVNTDNVFPVERNNNDLFNRFDLDSEGFYVTYCGNIGMTQNLALLIDVAERLSVEEPAIHFVIIGEGVEKDHLISLIDERHLHNVHVFPFQPYKDIAQVFSLGDVGLLISKKGVSLASVPSKTWSYMAASKPIVASIDEQSTLSSIITEASCGLVSDADDEEQLVLNIKQLYHDIKLSVEMGGNGLKYLKEVLNKDQCVLKYVDALKRVVEKENNDWSKNESINN